MNFTAIDFETANRQRASACSLALTIVKNDQVVDEIYSLINPEINFNWQNTKVNGIHSKDVIGAPTFPELWKVIKPFFNNNQLVVAHNANFDNAVLCDSIDRYGLQQPRYLTLDTLKSTRKLYPGFLDYKLNTVCGQLNIPLKDHHNALCDSTACAQILIHEHQQFGDTLIRPFINVIN
ncbi:3'-5' exonuclease [Acetilactobacillus jinshanensis]|uniref:DNA polymerase III polC-type n=1 Tax=Acetilactobacillus jinshanensis TaxID=1720083 RepID=A0A4P6ZMY0_9LACO|nr:3'-5' exonuclease [Acetilactobacillus jinshanensis]QBP18792.1 exonuclease [Acetilactobacillus jinshanensis]URL61663.1 3'-5' exonuclease [uncultured bacterium]